MSYNHHYLKFWRIITHTHTQNLIYHNHPPFHPPQAPDNQEYNLCFYGFPYSGYFHVSGITQYMTFCVYLISHRKMFTKFLLIVACVNTSFFLLLNYIPLYNTYKHIYNIYIPHCVVYTPHCVIPFIVW